MRDEAVNINRDAKPLKNDRLACPICGDGGDSASMCGPCVRIEAALREVLP